MKLTIRKYEKKVIFFLLCGLILFSSQALCSLVKTSNQNKVEGKNLNTNLAQNSIQNKVSVSSTAALNSESKINLKTNIFVSEKFLKHHSKNSATNGFNNKLYSQADLIAEEALNAYDPLSNAVSPKGSIGSNTKNDAVGSNSDIGQNTNLMSLAGAENSLSDLSLPKGPIFLQTWLKFFKYTDLDIMITTPKHFYQNNEFFNQKKYFRNSDLKEKSDDNYTFIRDKTSFFAVLFKKTLNFVTSRQVPLQRTSDSLNLDNILPVMESPGFKEGGILDFGNYNEGFCFKIVTSKPRLTNWVLCTETMDQKLKFMSTLKKLKLAIQRDEGVIMSPQLKNQKKETLSSVLNPDTGNSQNIKNQNGNLGVGFDPKQKITDGYWIVLQQWSQCNLKCGGGTSTLQRMCVPPKDGGAPCQGSAILTKKCNTHPCPDVLGTNNKNNNRTTTLKPVIKVMTFTSRPQRYTKCVVKESDLLWTQRPNAANSLNNNPELDSNISPEIQSIQIPTRVVMNNKTITIFSGEEYNTLVTTFNLMETNFIRSAKRKNCFILYESKTKEAELCPFGANSIGKALDEWDYDFNLFKFQCSTPRDVIDIDQNKLDAQLAEKIKNAKRELLDEREKEIKRKLAEKEQKDLEGAIKTTNQVALQAIQKELNLEEMIKQEEIEREARIEKEIRKNIEAEKKKSDCILKAIKERKLENQYNLRAKQTEDEIINIKKNAAHQVSIRRSQLKDAILKMRKQAKQRQNALQQELHTVRLSVADEMGKAYRKGDMNKCINSVKDPEVRGNYCTANFSDDFSKLSNCRESEDFVTICCDNEFGDFYMTERQTCYKIVGNIKPALGKPGDGVKVEGRWIWQNVLMKTN